AWRALEQVMDGLEASRRVDFIFLPKGEDPDQVVRREGSEGFQGRLRKAKPLLEFLLETLGQGLQIDTPEGMAALVHQVRQRLLKVADPLLRDLFADKVGQRYGLSGAQVLGAPHVRPPGTLSREQPSRFRHSPQEGRHPAFFPRQAMSGRNFEQALLAILLRRPFFMQKLQDDLERLELENPHMNALLQACIHLELEWNDDSPLALETLPTLELRTLA
ncbi:MAG: hypothetical protein H7833_21245, partial [Magnetococcus sp. DMHC-1]